MANGLRAKPYREGRGWALRVRCRGQELYVCGEASAAAARRAMQARLAALDGGRPYGLGPERTTLAQALQDYALERLPFMKGAVQDALRLNRHLRAAGLAPLVVTPADTDAARHGARFHVMLGAADAPRRIPAGLGAHRARQTAETREADVRRAFLVRLPVADVHSYHVQAFLDALRAAGRKPATLALERAALRAFFNHARNGWHWAAPARNPAVGLKLPAVRNQRERVMSAEEQARLDEALQACRNGLVAPVLTLLTETAMRSSEPLARARWRDVDWEAGLLHLTDSKSDARDVPLSPAALTALRSLQAHGPGAPDERIVRITYESLRAAWGRACERAGLSDLRLHDLRHTAATRMALKTGNVFLVQALTGHKTLSQVTRYVNVTATDVVQVLHAPATPPAAAAPTPPAAEAAAEPGGAQVIAVDFRTRRAG